MINLASRSSTLATTVTHRLSKSCSGNSAVAVCSAMEVLLFARPTVALSQMNRLFPRSLTGSTAIAKADSRDTLTSQVSIPDDDDSLDTS